MSRHSFLLQLNQFLPNVKEQPDTAKFTSEELGSNFLCSFVTTRTIMFYLLEKTFKGMWPFASLIEHFKGLVLWATSNDVFPNRWPKGLHGKLPFGLKNVHKTQCIYMHTHMYAVCTHMGTGLGNYWMRALVESSQFIHLVNFTQYHSFVNVVKHMTDTVVGWMVLPPHVLISEGFKWYLILKKKGV